MVFESVEVSTPAEESPPVSWPAIAAGAIAAAAMTLVLLAFGAGMGFSAVSPWGNSGISASTFQISTALYLMVVALLASALGGYVGGRLRTRWVGVHKGPRGDLSSFRICPRRINSGIVGVDGALAQKVNPNQLRLTSLGSGAAHIMRRSPTTAEM
jgi:hypothetical protein